MSEKTEKLFDQFPGVSMEEWRAKVVADLKGADFDKKLVWRTNEGFNVQPMYRAEDIADLKTTDSLPGEFPYVRGIRTTNDWLTRQEIIECEPEAANAVAVEVLTKGVTSLGFKVEDPSEATLATLMKGIDLSTVEINFTCCPRKALDLAAALVKYIKANGVEKTFRGSIDYNPLRRSLRHGKEADVPAIVETAKALLAEVSEVPGLKVLAVDSDMLSNSGAFIYQELGYALAWGADWLTLLTLYAAAWRAARAMGYRKIVTYILDTESGASLRAAGWVCAGLAGGKRWTGSRRPKEDLYPAQMKYRYEKSIGKEF